MVVFQQRIQLHSFALSKGELNSFGEPGAAPGSRIWRWAFVLSWEEQAGRD